jgi:hypothetical protein
MPFVSEDADDLRSQRFVQELDDRFAIRSVTLGHRTVLNMLSRALAQSFNVSEKWLIRHDLTPSR